MLVEDINFEKFLIKHNADVQHGSGYGWSFYDIKVGATFFFPPKWFILNYLLKNVEDLDMLTTCCLRNSQFENHSYVDKYKVVSKYERVKNLNPHTKLKYKDFNRVKCKNLRTGEVLVIGEDYFKSLYFDTIEK